MQDPQAVQPAIPAPVAQDTRAEQPAAPAAPNAELSKLAREARTLDADAPSAAESKQTTALALSLETQNRGELHAALVMIRKAALPLLFIASERKAAMLSAIWTDEALKEIADSGAQVLAMHGLRLGGLGLGPYVGLALSLGPVAYGTYAVLSSKDPEPAQVVGEGNGG